MRNNRYITAVLSGLCSPYASHGLRGLILAVLIVLLSACSSKKFLHEGEYVLTEIEMTSPDKAFKTAPYQPFVRHQPNAKWFTLFKVPLGFYCLSKADSVKGAKGFSGIMRKIGEAPTVFSPKRAEDDRIAVKEALQSKGYLHAEVDTSTYRKRHKIYLKMELHPGPRFYVNRWDAAFDDEEMYKAYKADAHLSLIRRGQPLDLNTLAAERTRVVNALRSRGYYYINNEFVSFDIDTIHGELSTDITLRFKMPPGVDSLRVYRQQRFEKVRVVEMPAENETTPHDTTEYRGLTVVAGQQPHLSKRVYVAHVGMRHDSLFNETAVRNTYSSLNALPAINYTSMRIRPVPGMTDKLDCEIVPGRNNPHAIGLELEGTNTSGDLGAAMALSYTNRNLWHGSELLILKVRGAYEAITGLEGYANQNYTEWSAEANLRFPTLLVPFIGVEDRRKLKATSEVQMMYNMQDRPEFHRRVLTGTWSYKWTHSAKPRLQHKADLVSINYVYMPWISDTFRKDYLEGDNPYYSVLRYSYENLFIMKTGYGIVYNSQRDGSNIPKGLYQTNGYQIKMNVELAGNLLYALSKMTHSTRNGSNNSYEYFGIAYSQYAKIDLDYVQSARLGDRNSIAFHAALGWGIPYGNSNILPYEKRYFAGGANSLRGWGVRELGPGAYKGKDGKIDFINQTGNLKLDFSVEWRTLLFWKLHGAFFVDAGNVWNTRTYTNMDGSRFRLNSFYKQIAVAYGLGIRFDLDYFILRLDGGMKAINPAVKGRLHYPLIHPNFKRDFALHFAVGLPF